MVLEAGLVVLSTSQRTAGNMAEEHRNMGTWPLTVTWTGHVTRVFPFPHGQRGLPPTLPIPMDLCNTQMGSEYASTTKSKFHHISKPTDPCLDPFKEPDTYQNS
jgi:hypothetical protein